MRAGYWCALALLAAVAGASCGEGDAALQAASAEALVASARTRFAVLDEVVGRAVALERVSGGFRPRDPPQWAAAAPPRRHPALDGIWSKPGNHHLGAELPARSGGVIRLSNGPVTIEIRPEGVEDVPGTTAGKTLVYKGQYPGADSVHVAEKQRVEEFVVLRDEQAPRQFEYLVTVVRGGGRVRKLGGVIEALDDRGTAWLRLVRPWVVDGKGERHTVLARLKGSRLLLSLPDRAAGFPMLLDPGWTTTGSMAQARSQHTATRLANGNVLVAGGSDGVVSLASAELFDPATGAWTSTGKLAKARKRHTARLLGDGTILIAGGGAATGSLASAEVYDPVAGKWSAKGSMANAGNSHTMTVLKTGKVMVTGGLSGAGSFARAELYDPGAGTWSATGSMASKRYLHTATLLDSGKVLATGGYGTGAEVYDPGTGTWSATGAPAKKRSRHTAVLLKNGKVLVAGGWDGGPYNSAELYDPVSGTWSATGSMNSPRYQHAAALLGSGKVLFAGGSNPLTSTNLSSAELYDPVSGSWQKTVSMAQVRIWHSATLLSGGEVLVAGGAGGSVLASAERYQPATGRWSSTGKMTRVVSGHSATLLADGKLLVTGGGTSGSSASAEVYDPASQTWTPTASMTTPRSGHTGTLLGTDKVLVTGGGNGKIPNAELYDPAMGSWSATGSMANARRHHSATLLGNGTVLVAGGYNPSAKGLTSAELYDPKTGAWSATGSMANKWIHHTATLLGSGKVLVAGNSSSPELYNPVSGTWSTTGKMTAARSHHTATLLGSGKVLVAGGGWGPILSSAELYDPASGTWSATGSMASPRRGHTATLLGVVLAAGGTGGGATAELYDPTTGSWMPARNMSTSRAGHTATLLATGKVLVAGGLSSGGATAELYDPRDLIACRGAADCASGFCADGYCCDTACMDTCKACVVQVSAKGVLGKCADVPAEAADKAATKPCSGASACDGKGACKKAAGQVCSGSADCAAGLCHDGYCCKDACGGTCMTCGLSSSKGQCTFVLKEGGDPNGKIPCASPKACDGAGLCKVAQGQPCTAGSACASNHCADGRCCDTACDETCKACDLPGKAGTCTFVPAGQADAQAQPACSGNKVCDGKGGCLLAQGQTCAKHSACASGHCADYVCCDTACTGICRSCAVPGSAGSCGFTPAGTQDLNASTTCSTPLACDGKGGCHKANGASCTTKAACASGHCVDGVCCATACDASCKACNVTSYLGTCTTVADGAQDLWAQTPCAGAKVCIKGVCGKSAGQACAKGAECASGFCADQTCCDVACDAACRACDQPVSASKPGVKPGKCSPVEAGKQDLNAATPCSGNHACNNIGQCKKAVGQGCSKHADCGTGFCADGICCDTTCDAQCKSCAITGKQGTCSNSVAMLPDPNAKFPCVKPLICDGSGSCKKDVRELCTANAQCAAGYCIDGVCCLTECKGNCMTCYQSDATRGTCKPHPKGLDPDKDCQGKDAKCGGKCDGAGKCDYPSTGSICGKSPCMACDGTGQCSKTPPDDSRCGVIDCDKLDTTCKDYHDLVGGRCASLGICDKPNDPASCVKHTALACDAGVEAGTPDLGPYTDAGSPAELGPKPPPAGDSGCSCQATDPGQHTAGMLCMFMLLALALVSARRAGPARR